MFSRGLCAISLMLAVVSAQPQWEHRQGWRQQGWGQHFRDGQAPGVSTDLADADTASSIQSKSCVETLSATASVSSSVTVNAASSPAAAVTPSTRKSKTRKHTKTTLQTSAKASRTRVPPVDATPKSKKTSAKGRSTKAPNTVNGHTSKAPASSPSSQDSAVTSPASPSAPWSPPASSPQSQGSAATSPASPAAPSPLPATSATSSSSTSEPVAPTSAETSPATAPPVSSGGSKRGLITFDELIPAFADNDKITWNMNWWHGPPDGKPADWFFLPQLTHLEPDEWWADATFRKDPASYPYIAGFLEPGVNGISVADAVKSWKANLEPLSANHKLIPPVVGQNDLPWLQEFMTACTGCTFEGPIAFTLYVSPDDDGIADFKNHVAEFTAAFPDKDVWAANIGILGDKDLSKSDWLMKQIVPLLDANDRISHYAWNGDLGDGKNSFWDGSSLTPLGQLYATL